MGMSYGKSLDCPSAYNDMTSLSFMWSTLADALNMGSSHVCGKNSTCRHEPPQAKTVQQTETVGIMKQPFPERRTRDHRQHGFAEKISAVEEEASNGTDG